MIVLSSILCFMSAVLGLGALAVSPPASSPPFMPHAASWLIGLGSLTALLLCGYFDGESADYSSAWGAMLFVLGGAGSLIALGVMPYATAGQSLAWLLALVVFHLGLISVAIAGVHRLLRGR